MTKPILIKRPEVERITSLSRSAIYAAMEAGDFPRPVRIGRRAVAWRVADIENWLVSRPRAIPGGDQPSEPRKTEDWAS